MKVWLIKWLYSQLDDAAKFDVYQKLKCPSLDAALLSQCKSISKFMKRF